jgi:excisionase family DNA binding protein
MIDISNKEMLNSREAAAFTGISLSYLRKLMMQRKIAYSKPLGKLAFFKKEDLIAFMQMGKVATATEIASQATAIDSALKSKKGGSR